MERFNASSIVPSNSNASTSLHDDPALLDGVASEVKLLLKLIQDHNACSRETDARRPKRLATMMTILDDVRSRVEKAQTHLPKRKPELRRCATEHFRNPEGSISNKDKEPKPTLSPNASGRSEEDNAKLRRQLSASMTARKSLEKMFSSLSKEKEMIAGELAKRVHEATLMEEEISDLRKQNEKLMEKASVCAAQHQEGSYDHAGGGGEGGDAAAMQERNSELTEQLIRSVEAYRTVRRRLKEVMEERERVNGRISEVAMEAAAGFDRVRRLRERVGHGGGDGGGGDGGDGGIGEELCMLERAFAGFYRRLLMGAGVPSRGASPTTSPSRAE